MGAFHQPYNNQGGVAERFKAAVLKTAVPRGTVGSNPTPSATFGAGKSACLPGGIMIGRKVPTERWPSRLKAAPC